MMFVECCVVNPDAGNVSDRSNCFFIAKSGWGSLCLSGLRLGEVFDSWSVYISLADVEIVLEPICHKYAADALM